MAPIFSRTTVYNEKHYITTEHLDSKNTHRLLDALSIGLRMFETEFYQFELCNRSIVQTSKRSGIRRMIVIGKFSLIAWIIALFPEIVVVRQNQCVDYIREKLHSNTIAMSLCFHGMILDAMALSCGHIISNMKKIKGFTKGVATRDVSLLDSIAKTSESLVAGNIKKLLVVETYFK